MRSRSNTIKNYSITFKLKNDRNFVGDHYLHIRTKDQKQEQIVDNIIGGQMQLESEGQYYEKTVEIKPNVQYEYCYSRKIGDQIEKENDFRGFQFSLEDSLEIDEWNKKWYKYVFNYSAHNPNIFNGYLTLIREKDSKNNHFVKLDKTSNYIMSGKEILELDKTYKQRQLCFIQLNYDKENIIQQLYSIQYNQFNNEYQSVININKGDKFSSNFNLIEVKDIDSEAKQRMESYSKLYDEVKTLKQKIINLEQNFNEFKNSAEKSIQNYIDQNEQANQKIMELELEFSKLNFQSEEIKIYIDDSNQLSKEEKDSLQQLQEKLNNYEYMIKEMKEEKEFLIEKKENKVSQFNECQNSLKIYKKQIEQCKEQIEKFKKESDIVQYETIQDKQKFQKRSETYQQKLKEVNTKLNSKESYLNKQLEAILELEQKYQDEQQKNINEKQEFNKKFKDLQEQQQKIIDDLQDENKLTLEQYEQDCQQKINQAIQQRKLDQNKKVDIEAKLKYKQIKKEANSNFKLFNTRQEQIEITNHQFQLSLQEISNLLQQLQEDTYDNLKHLGVQVISELSKKSLINKSFLIQVSKLIVILNLISINQDSQDISHIKKLELLNTKLQQNYINLMRKCYYYQNLFSEQRSRKYYVLIMLAFIYLCIFCDRM